MHVSADPPPIDLSLVLSGVPLRPELEALASRAKEQRPERPAQLFTLVQSERLMRVRSDGHSPHNAGLGCATTTRPVPRWPSGRAEATEIRLVARLEDDRLLQLLARHVECVAPRRTD